MKIVVSIIQLEIGTLIAAAPPATLKIKPNDMKNTSSKTISLTLNVYAVLIIMYKPAVIQK